MNEDQVSKLSLQISKACLAHGWPEASVAITAEIVNQIARVNTVGSLVVAQKGMKPLDEMQSNFAQAIVANAFIAGMKAGVTTERHYQEKAAHLILASNNKIETPRPFEIETVELSRTGNYPGSLCETIDGCTIPKMFAKELDKPGL